MLASAGPLGWQVITAEIGSDRDYEAAFAKFVEGRAGALVVALSPIFASDADDIIALTLRLELPTIFQRRADVIAGGLISYGASQVDAWHQGGVYAGQILNATKPANMPVIQSTKLEMIINLVIAKSLAFAIPPKLLAQANELIQ
jgi:putative tryptophan/tyrosine transport system substrate-binding protein